MAAARWWPAWWLLHRPNAPFVHPDTPAVEADINEASDGGNATPPTPDSGDFIDHYGLTFYWTPRHRVAALLEPLRSIGDPLCDAWLADTIAYLFMLYLQYYTNSYNN